MMENTMVASINSADRAATLLSRVDTKKQGFIDKAELETALSKSGKGNSTERADRLFEQLDGDKDGKVTESELSSAINKVSDQLRSQLNQSRAPRRGDGPPPPPPPPVADDDTSSYNAAADTNSDGTVSAEEAAAYAALQASATRDTGLTKEQLTEKRDTLDATDTRRQGALAKLIDNFDAADANGDGKLTRREGRDYLKANRPEAGRQDSGFSAFARALQSLDEAPATPVVSTTA
jgi:Ca2+-binding EF-hand superfamily protein